VLIRSDGEAAAFGSNIFDQCLVPPLTSGRRYIAAAAGENHSVLIRSDGSAVAFGDTLHDRCEVPALPPGSVTYTRAAAGESHTLLLRSNGEVVCFGSNTYGQCTIPPPPAMGASYTEVAAGSNHSILLRNDGCVVAFGRNTCGQCNMPDNNQGYAFDGIAAGVNHTLLLRRDGLVLAFGSNRAGQCDIPCAPDGLSYQAMAAGHYHTVLLRCDGTAIAFGSNRFHQCDVAEPPKGCCYACVSAGKNHTVLILDDGQVRLVGEGAELESGRGDDAVHGDPTLNTILGDGDLKAMCRNSSLGRMPTQCIEPHLPAGVTFGGPPARLGASPKARAPPLEDGGAEPYHSLRQVVSPSAAMAAVSPGEAERRGGGNFVNFASDVDAVGMQDAWPFEEPERLLGHVPLSPKSPGSWLATQLKSWSCSPGRCGDGPSLCRRQVS